MNLSNADNIVPLESGRLRAPMRRRQPPKDILSRRMKESGKNAPAIKERAAERGANVSAETVKAILRGDSSNAGLFTWEAIAAGLDVPPLQLIAELLGESVDDPQIKSGQFALLHELYKELTPTQRAKADLFISALRRELTHLKNQK